MNTKKIILGILLFTLPLISNAHKLFIEGRIYSVCEACNVMDRRVEINNKADWYLIAYYWKTAKYDYGFWGFKIPLACPVYSEQINDSFLDYGFYQIDQYYRTKYFNFFDIVFNGPINIK